jgi:hypothetical protein
MKIKIVLTAFFLIVFHSISAQPIFEKWVTIKEFNDVLSQTFQPTQTGNLEPIKLRSEELMNKAADLLKSDIPAEFRTKNILSSAEKLQIKSKILHQLIVTKVADAEILKSLTELHQILQEITDVYTDDKK